MDTPADIAAAGRFADTFGRTAEEVAHAANKIEERRATVEAVDIATKYNKETQKLLHDQESGLLLRKEGAAEGLYKETESLLEEKKNALYKDASPRAIELAKRRIEEVQSGRLHEVSLHEATERQKDVIRAINDVDANAAQNIARLSSPTLIQEEIDQALELKRMLSPNGELSELDKLKTVGALAYVAVQSRLNEGDVKSANALMNQYGKELDAMNKRDDLMQKAKTVNTDNTVTSLVVELRNKNGNDLMAAIKEANSTGFIDKWGVDIQQKVDASLAVQWNRSETAYKEKAEPIKGNLFNKVMDGIKPTDKELEPLRSYDRAWVNNAWKSHVAEVRREQRIEAMENRQDKALSKQEAKETSFNLKAKAIQELQTGKVLNEYDLIGESYAGLSKEDRTEVLGIVKAIENDSGFKDVFKTIGKYEKNKYFSSNKQDNAKKALEFTTETRRIMFAEKLQGEALVKRITPMLEAQKRNWFDNVFDEMLNNARVMNERTMKVPPQKTTMAIATDGQGNVLEQGADGKWRKKK
jgi:hypothetical protein